MPNYKTFIITYTVIEQRFEPQYDYGDPDGRYISVTSKKYAIATTEQELIDILSNNSYKDIKVYDATPVEVNLRTTVSLSIN